MLAARALTIIWGDTPYYWNWITLPESRSAIEFHNCFTHCGCFYFSVTHVNAIPLFLSLQFLNRFPEVAQLSDVCWLEIRGVMSTLALSPNTQYAAYLVFKMVEADGFENRPVELSVGIFGGETSTKNVCLDPNSEGRQHNKVVGLQRPNVKRDGWLEIEMGEFFNSGLEDEEVQMSVWEVRGGNWKRGLTIEGIEIRPKEEEN